MLALQIDKAVEPSVNHFTLGNDVFHVCQQSLAISFFCCLEVVERIFCLKKLLQQQQMPVLKIQQDETLF